MSSYDLDHLIGVAEDFAEHHGDECDHQIAAALRDLKALRDRMADYEEAARITLDDCGAPDEKHCSCVPTLRAEVERLRGLLEDALNHPGDPYVAERIRAALGAADQPAAVRVCDTCGNPVEVMPFKTHAPHHEPMQHVLCDVCKTAITERRRADQPAAVYERPKCDCLYPHPAQYVPNFCGVCHGVIADKPDVTHGGSHEADQD